MLKTLVILGFLALVIWFFFFKKKPKHSHLKTDSMVECRACKTFVMQDEAILSNGSYYCSQECLMRG